MRYSQTSIAFVESFHRAFKTQMHYAHDHPSARHASEAFFDLAIRLLEGLPSVELAAERGRLHLNGAEIEGAPNACQGLAEALEEHSIQTLVFRRGLEADDLQLLFFILHLQPYRLNEMGGADFLLADTRGLQARVRGTSPTTARPISLPPPSPRALADDLLGLFSAVVQMTAAPLRPNPRAPWTLEQREALSSFGFLAADLASLVGTGEQLGLSGRDPSVLRSALRTALVTLDPILQGALLLGLPAFPSEEMALRRALDYLAPEIMAQALVEAILAHPDRRFDLALAAAAMLHCVKDRELGLEALKGRLMMEGWSLQDAETLEEAIRWECHGTDTKLQLTLANKCVFELEPHQLAILVRQLARGKRIEALRDLLIQLEGGFASPHVLRRRMAAETLADLAECLEDPGLPPEAQQRLLSVLHGHITSEEDPQAARWSSQALESLLAHWMTRHHFSAVYAEMLALGELTLAPAGSPEWKVQAIRDLLTRLASPPNLALLVPILHEAEARLSLPQLHALLTLLGRPAAHFVVACLELEEDEVRRGHLHGALRAIGRNAVPALVDALASSQATLVRRALELLAEIGHQASFTHAALALSHRDYDVRKAALHAVMALGSQEQAVEALVTALKESDPTFQLDCLSALGDLGHASAVPVVVHLMTDLKGASGDKARLRLRAVEVLGRLRSDAAIPALQDLFKRRGFLSSREGTSIRLAAVKALEALGSREARETLALILDQENDDEIRIAIRKILV